MGGLISVEEASRSVLAQARAVVRTSEVALDACLGRRLADDLVSAGPWPATDRSAMDGFALRFGDADGAAAGECFAVVGEALAGHPFEGAIDPGEAVRIMTGAVVPADIDAVVPVENTSGFGGESMTLEAPVRRGANIRPRGSEVAAGAVVLERGTLIGSAEVGVLAVLGRERVPVVAAPEVAILPTGDEVVPIDHQPLPHQVRDSNSWSLAAQVVEAGGIARRLAVGADRREALLERLGEGLASADVLITIGGVSKGTHDLVHGCLEELGVEQIFHGVRLKPGKPTFFGIRSDAGGSPDRYVFGLPGNPVSCHCAFTLLVRPLLTVLGGGGAPRPMVLPRSGVDFRRNARAQAIPTRIEVDAGGQLRAVLERLRPSGDPFGLVGTHGYALVPPDAEPAATPTVEVWPFRGSLQP